jgi:hypothetical protein
MSYLIGCKLNDTNIITCDSMSTHINSDEKIETTSDRCLKSGILFPGCIFGFVGNIPAANKFIDDCFFNFTNYDLKNCDSLWERFNVFVEDYNFLIFNGRHFEFLLSSRATGRPIFYRLSSKDGKLHSLENEKVKFITLGTGKDILDFDVWVKFNNFLRDMSVQLKNFLAPNVNPIEWIDPWTWDELSPHILCFFLSQLAFTYESSKLEEYRVGGSFHFIEQTAIMEKPQGPAFYIFADPILRPLLKIYLWPIRITNVLGALVETRWVPPGQSNSYPEGNSFVNISLNSATDRLLKGLARQQAIDKVNEHLKKQPYYNFCAIDFSNPIYRGPMFLIPKNGKDDDIFTGDKKTVFVNEINEFIMKRINQKYYGVK